ncbi:MAG: hypothetical protein MR377_05750 [Lactobacillus johnsonii]|nr:hypothetical protein [Lactobacillus johnsonii]
MLANYCGHNLKETIATSKHAYEDMKEQLAVKDDQISSLTKLTTNAQTLNLLDKPKPNKSNDAETKPEQSSSDNEVANQPNSETEKPHKNWWQRHFGK